MNFLIVLLLFYSPIHEKFDSLKSVLFDTKGEKQKKELLFELAYAYRNICADSTEFYISKITTSIDIIKTDFQAESMHLYGQALTDLLQFGKSDSILNRVIDYYKSKDDLSALSLSFNSLGLNYMKQSNQGEARNCFIQGMNILKNDTINYVRNFANMYFNMGHSYRIESNCPESLKYYYKALICAEKIENYTLEMQILSAIALCYETKSELSKQRKIYREILEHKSQLPFKFRLNTLMNLSISFAKDSLIDSSKHYALLVIDEIESESLQSSYYSYYGTLANIYSVDGKLELARKYYLKEQSYIKEYNDHLGLGINFLNLGNTYWKSDTPKALELYTKAYNIIQFEDNPNLMQFLTKKIATTKAKLNDYKGAFDLILSAYQTKDIIYNEEKAKIQSELEVLYETEKKEQENELLRQDKKINDLTIKQQKLIIYGVGVIALLVGLISLLLWRRNKAKEKNNARLIIKNRQIDQLKNEIDHRLRNQMNTALGLLEQYKSTIKNSQTKIAFEEYEQKLYALSSLGQLLSAKNMEKNVSVKKYLEQVTSNLIFNSNKGENEIKINHTYQELDISHTKALNIALIITELFTNTIKYAFPHANTPEIVIQLIKDDDDLILLSYEDNGVGLSPTQKKKGKGMKIIQDLITQIDGEGTFINRESGFQYEATIPL